MKWLPVLVVGYLYFLLSDITSGTLSKADRKKGNKEREAELSTETVVKRGLVSTKVKATNIVREHQNYCDMEREIKHFPGDTLAYVTPWNGHGYDVAKLFAHKFTYVSPVWLQIQCKAEGSYSVLGAHDIDKEWMAEVRGDGKVQIVPRVLFDGWSTDDFTLLFNSEREQDIFSRTLSQFLQRYRFQGMVLEVWSQMRNARQKAQLVHFVTHLGEDFQEAGLTFILVLPPPVGHGTADSPELIGTGALMKEEFESMVPFVTAVSLMTYDFSSPQRPGPNSPLQWVRANVEYLVPDPSSALRRKILMGLNFYGNKYIYGGVGGPIIGSQYIDMLSKNKPKLKWESGPSEHVFTFKSREGDHLVWYPTLQSISDRLKLAESLGAGVSIWEIGQGLDYFYDLL